MNDITRIITNPRRGRAVVHNGIVYIGGQTANDRTADIKGQTQQTLAKIDEVLSRAGTSRENLLTAQIWMKNIGRDFAGMNEIWDGWIDSEHAPTRATAQCDLASPDVLVEIIVTAATAHNSIP